MTKNISYFNDTHTIQLLNISAIKNISYFFDTHTKWLLVFSPLSLKSHNQKY